MVHAACLGCFISTVNGCIKKKRKEKRSLESAVLVAGTQQTLSTLFFVFRYLWELPKMPKGRSLVLLPAVYLKTRQCTLAF
jgi:hypothetical protein